MSFGRWLLVNSFSIFLLGLFFFGYIYRDELQLENAYHQLFKIDPKTVITLSPRTGQPQIVEQQANNKVDQQMEKSKSAIVTEKQSTAKLDELLKTVPTVSSPPVEASKKDGGSVVATLSAEERLYMARQAHWDKNYTDAIYLYRQLIQENSNNPDYLGELGNIYYSLNDNQNASRLYFQAAMVFINHNQPDRARLLIAPVTAMNRELGEKLKFRLQ